MKPFLLYILLIFGGILAFAFVPTYAEAQAFIVVTPSSKVFPDTPELGMSTETYTAKNTGATVGVLDELSNSLPPGVFVCISGCGTPIPPLVGTVTLVYEFTPPSIGVHTAIIVLCDIAAGCPLNTENSIVAEGTGIAAGIATEIVNFEIDSSAGPAALSVGTPATITAKLQTTAGAGISGKTLFLWVSTDSGATWASAAPLGTDTSDFSGNVSFSWTPNALTDDGLYRLRFGGDATHDLSVSSNIDVTVAGGASTASSVIINFENPIKATSFTGLVNTLINFLFTIAVILAPILLVVAGIIFMTAGGDPGRVSMARRMLLWTIVGFGIILISKGLVSVLGGILGI